MNGERNLQNLLQNMTPRLNEGDYVFCQVDPKTAIDLRQVVGTFREAEGLTVILSREKAEEYGWPSHFVAAWITLEVHSALDAVGLTAAFSTALGRENISCNVVAAHHHDHIFVAKADAQRAMEVLQALSQTLPST